jgi:hypothetical protein
MWFGAELLLLLRARILTGRGNVLAHRPARAPRRPRAAHARAARRKLVFLDIFNINISLCKYANNFRFLLLFGTP